jgi:hypothetical protein
MMDQISGRCFLVDAGTTFSSPSAITGSFGQASTPAQEVFGSPLILHGQFFISPKLSSKNCLKQSSRTLSAAKHSFTRHYKEAVTCHRLLLSPPPA